jgi:hypothetical protein
MPKKATSTRNRAQRNKPKAQKSFELVLPEKVVPETEESSTISASISTADGPGQALPLRAESKTSERPSKADRPGQVPPLREESKTSGKVDGQRQAPPLREEQVTKSQEEQQNTSAPKSASARLAARRQAVQKLQQRSAAPLITSEHFAYVRNDLIKIAVFAVIMITAIIVLYFTLGRA